MTNEHRAALRQIQARADAAGRRVAQLRIEGATVEAVAQADADLQAIQAEGTALCASLGFQVVR